MKIGYARVSTEEQDLASQVDALLSAGCEKVFEEKVSGASDDKQELARLIAFARKGDVLTVVRLDRLGRSTRKLLELVDDLRARGIGLASLRESIDTATPTGKVMLSILAAFAEMERELIVERTRAGLASARARGRVGGRKGITKEQEDLIAVIAKDRAVVVGDACRAIGVSRSTYYKYRKKRGVTP